LLLSPQGPIEATDEPTTDNATVGLAEKVIKKSDKDWLVIQSRIEYKLLLSSAS
jgi:hypothetical protein